MPNQMPYASLAQLYNPPIDQQTYDQQIQQSQAAQKMLMQFLMQFSPGSTPSQSPAPDRTFMFGRGMPNFERARADAQMQVSPQMTMSAPDPNSVFPEAQQEYARKQLVQAQLMNLFRMLQPNVGQPSRGTLPRIPDLDRMEQLLGIPRR